jgi:hypothetical protein
VEISWRKVYNPLVEHQRHCSPSIYKRGKCADKKNWCYFWKFTWMITICHNMSEPWKCGDTRHFTTFHGDTLLTPKQIQELNPEVFFPSYVWSV